MGVLGQVPQQECDTKEKNQHTDANQRISTGEVVA